MDITCIGCLHGFQPILEGGDLLIVTGDLTARHTKKEHFEFNEWLQTQDYKKIILIAGNHDSLIEKKGDHDSLDFYGQKVQYLCDSGTQFEGLKIWGSPWSSWCHGMNSKCQAFTYTDRGKHYDEHVSIIPKDIDILITHEPAFGILDAIPQQYDGSFFHVGSYGLYNWIKYEGRPRLHVCSHIHEGYGQAKHFVSNHNDDMMISVNCSIMNENYKPVNPPIRITL